MQTEFVMAVCDVYVKWKQGDPPRYRCYVNDELFTERSWIWHDNILKSIFQFRLSRGTIPYDMNWLNPEYAQN
jgi:hypothetical protein